MVKHTNRNREHGIGENSPSSVHTKVNGISTSGPSRGPKRMGVVIR
jgi:hypothetical protein